MTETITLSISPRGFLIILLMILLLIASLVTIIILPEAKKRDTQPALLRWIKNFFNAEGKWDRDIVIAFMCLAFIPLFLFAIVAAYQLVLAVAFGTNQPTANAPGFGASFATGALLVSILGLPFLVWRTVLAQNTARTQALSLFNEKINAATEGLHAMRQITKDGETLHEPDITRRNAAIDALHGLAQERPDEASRVARMLSVYVREVSSKEAPPEPTDNGENVFLSPVPKKTIKIARSDLQAAVAVLGRLRAIKGAKIGRTDINLSGANLQAMELLRLDFRHVSFVDANMAHAWCSNTQFQAANFAGANLSWAILDQAHLEGANMQSITVTGSELAKAHIRGSFISGLNMFADVFMEKRRSEYISFAGPLTGYANHWVRAEDNRLEQWRAFQDTLANFPDEYKVQLPD